MKAMRLIKCSENIGHSRNAIGKHKEAIWLNSTGFPGTFRFPCLAKHGEPTEILWSVLGFTCQWVGDYSNLLMESK